MKFYNEIGFHLNLQVPINSLEIKDLAKTLGYQP